MGDHSLRARRTLFSAAKDKASSGCEAARPGECLSQGLRSDRAYYSCGDAQRGCQDALLWSLKC